MPNSGDPFCDAVYWRVDYLPDREEYMRMVDNNKTLQKVIFLRKGVQVNWLQALTIDRLCSAHGTDDYNLTIGPEGYGVRLMVEDAVYTVTRDGGWVRG